MRVPTLGLLLALALGGIVIAEVTPGQERSIQVRDGVAVRVEPKPLAARQGRLPFGARVSVLDVRGFWARVSADGGLTGWVRTNDLVERGALTSAAAGGADSRSSEVSLAGRQFDEATEGDLKATEADLAAAYPLVDQMERKSIKSGSPELEAFIAEGHLGQGK